MPSQLSRRQFMLLALQLLAATQLPACRSNSPVLGKDPIGKPLVVEDHSQALAHWAGKGIRDAVLINIDTHDDMRWIPENRINALSDIYRKKEWQRFRDAGTSAENGLYHLGNWILAGHRLGIFREVVWVIPFEVLSMQDPEAKMRRFLKDYEFSDAEISTFSLRGRRFSGSFHGLPVTICDIRSLPEISSPILLSLDTDFFPPYSTVHEKSYLQSLHEVFQALYAKKYRINDAVISYSVNGDFLPPHLRWVGDTLAMILENPGLLAGEPPQLTLLMQELDNHYRGTDSLAMLKLIETWQAANPAEASIQTYGALAAVLKGDADSAYKAAAESCRMDKRYCAIFPYIGTYYYSGGKYQTAERFYLAGFAANPAMANGLFQYGHCLRKTGRIKEAIQFYEKDEARNGSFPTRFLIAEMQMLLGNTKAAKESIVRAVESLSRNRYAQVVNDETASAIHAALNFCNREGLRDLSAALRNNPSVVAMFRDYPRK